MNRVERKKLTKRVIDAIKTPSDGEIIGWDSEIRGFFIRVLSSGTRTYYLKYRMPGGRRAQQRQIKIGRHGDLTVEKAREIALSHKALISKNVDPKIEREKNSGITFSNMVGNYLKEIEKRGVEHTSTHYRCMAETYILPALGSKKASAIQSSDIGALHRRMIKTPYQANRVLAVISAIFNSAKRNKIIECENPCVGIKKYPEKHRERFLSEMEIARLKKVLEKAKEKGLKFFDKKSKKERLYMFSPYVIAAIRMLLLTGARLNEILCLEWSQVDEKQKLLRLPNSKTGKKDILVSDSALALLREMKRVKGNPYVFVGHVSKEHLVNIYKSWKLICEHAKINNTRIHDLRHTFASTAISNNVSLSVVGGLLGHKNASTTSRYAHLSDKSLRDGIIVAEKALNEALGSN